MKYHVVEIAGVRLYAVDFHMSKMVSIHLDLLMLLQFLTTTVAA